MSTQSSVDKSLHQRMESENVRATNPIAERVEELREEARNLYERSKHRAVQLEHQFEGQIREHPLRSIAISAGIGAALGILLGVLAARR